MGPILFFFTIMFGTVASTETAPSLLYEPAVVTLEGTVSLQNFARPPTYEDVNGGDQLERAWILTLRNPVRVVACPNDELFFTQENVREVQLVCSDGCAETFLFSDGEEVALVGTLFSAHTLHHHRGVLMTVKNRE